MDTSFFGAPPIPLEHLSTIERTTPNLILWAVPVMIFFTVLEMIFTYVQEKPFYDKRETVGSILVGLGSLVISAALKLALLYATVWIYNQLPWRMAFNWWTLIPCYIIFDLCSYWTHRISHSSRFWWATHVVHHSSQQYNLTVSFRLSWIQNLKVIFFLPVALLGFHPIIFFTTNQLAVLFQFWVHTEYIRRLPRWIEFVFATPSNHRVHHGSQPKYIDKNFGATFIFWDRLFGTYQLEEEPPVYGITTNINQKANPFVINFHEVGDIIRDIKAAQGWRQKWFYSFGSPIEVDRQKKEAVQKRAGRSLAKIV